jgi:hypothetical protein
MLKNGVFKGNQRGSQHRCIVLIFTSNKGQDVSLQEQKNRRNLSQLGQFL